MTKEDESVLHMNLAAAAAGVVTCKNLVQKDKNDVSFSKETTDTGPSSSTECEENFANAPSKEDNDAVVTHNVTTADRASVTESDGYNKKSPNLQDSYNKYYKGKSKNLPYNTSAYYEKASNKPRWVKKVHTEVNNDYPDLNILGADEKNTVVSNTGKPLTLPGVKSLQMENPHSTNQYAKYNPAPNSTLLESPNRKRNTAVFDSGRSRWNSEANKSPQRRSEKRWF